MGRMWGYAIRLRKILTKENYEKLKSVEDDDLRRSLCEVILKFYEDSGKTEEVKHQINETLKHFWEFYELVGRVIELEKLKIQKLENIRKGILPYMLKAGVDKLEEIRVRIFGGINA